jgi:predicted nucleic acid-binding protein
MWSVELNDAVKMDTVIASLFTDKSSALPHGNVYHLPASHNMTANTKVTAVDAVPEAIVETEQTYTVSLHQIVARQIESPVEVQSKYDLRKDYTDKASYALARAQDVACAALFSAGTQIVGTAGAELSYANFLSARKFLRDSAAKGKLVAVVSPATYNGLLKIDEFINQLYNGDTSGMAIREAQVGQILRTTIYESQLLSGAGVNSIAAMWAMGHYFKIVQKPPKTDTWYSPLAKAWISAMDQLYGMFERLEADEAAGVTTTARLWTVRLDAVK